MRYIKQLILIGAIGSALFAEHQISVRGGATKELDAISSATGKIEAPIPYGDLNYHGIIPVGESIHLKGNFVAQIQPGAEKDQSSYYYHRTYPFLFDGNFSTLFNNNIHSTELLLEGEMTPKANAIIFPIVGESSLQGSTLTRENALGVATRYTLKADHFVGGADATYRINNFNRMSADSTLYYRESDLYYHGTVHASFLDHQLFAGVSINGKNDMNEYSGYDQLSTALEAGTALILNKRKTQIYSRIALTDLKGEMIKANPANGYVTGIGEEAYLRLSQKLKKNFWLKADFDLSSRAGDVTKSRIGGSVKKAWGPSILEGGYWSTPGSLFPRQCGWASGSFRMIENHLELEPSVTNYWIEEKESYRYYRTDMGMAVNVRPMENLRKITVSGGGLWRNYKDSPRFVSGIEFFAGIETLL